MDRIQGYQNEVLHFNFDNEGNADNYSKYDNRAEANIMEGISEYAGQQNSNLLSFSNDDGNLLPAPAGAISTVGEATNGSVNFENYQYGGRSSSLGNIGNTPRLVSRGSFESNNFPFSTVVGNTIVNFGHNIDDVPVVEDDGDIFSFIDFNNGNNTEDNNEVFSAVDADNVPLVDGNDRIPTGYDLVTVATLAVTSQLQNSHHERCKADKIRIWSDKIAVLEQTLLRHETELPHMEFFLLNARCFSEQAKQRHENAKAQYEVSRTRDNLLEYCNARSDTVKARVLISSGEYNVDMTKRGMQLANDKIDMSRCMINAYSTDMISPFEGEVLDGTPGALRIGSNGPMDDSPQMYLDADGRFQSNISQWMYPM